MVHANSQIWHLHLALRLKSDAIARLPLYALIAWAWTALPFTSVQATTSFSQFLSNAWFAIRRTTQLCVIISGYLSDTLCAGGTVQIWLNCSGLLGKQSRCRHVRILSYLTRAGTHWTVWSDKRLCSSGVSGASCSALSQTDVVLNPDKHTHTITDC